jgi:hypothetical protein
MIAFWDFEHSDGKTVKDASGNNLYGRLFGDAHVTNDPDRGGQVLSLDGSRDWVECGKDVRFDISSEITVACWIRVRSFHSKWQTVMSKGDNAWRLARHEETGRLELACTGASVPGVTWGGISGKRNVNDGKWHHVVGVYDGARMSLYIDGALDVSSEASGEIGTNNWSVLIGANEEMAQPDRSFDGLIDDVRIYDYALSEAEIKALYGGQGPGPTADRR